MFLRKKERFLRRRCVGHDCRNEVTFLSQFPTGNLIRAQHHSLKLYHFKGTSAKLLSTIPHLLSRSAGLRSTCHEWYWNMIVVKNLFVKFGTGSDPVICLHPLTLRDCFPAAENKKLERTRSKSFSSRPDLRMLWRWHDFRNPLWGGFVCRTFGLGI